MAHEMVNPKMLAPAVGFAHAVKPADGRMVFLAGQAGHGPDGRIAGHDLVAQFAVAAANVAEALRATGGEPQDVVWMQVFTTDVIAYRTYTTDIGAAWREVFGHHYPAMSLIGVTELYDPDARVELVALAVVPSGR